LSTIDTAICPAFDDAQRPADERSIRASFFAAKQPTFCPADVNALDAAVVFAFLAAVGSSLVAAQYTTECAADYAPEWTAIGATQ
jgi:hypothetical protein